jgi:hypothetical protein
MMTLSNPPDANAPTAPSLGADVEMLNNQLTVSSNNHPPLTVVTVPPSEISIQEVAAATAEQFQVGMCYDSEHIL